MRLSVQTIRYTAKILFFILTFELVAPCVSFALTSGPSQPEVTSFEPVGTTDMVDLFTGDFVYNIPLLDVDGYPINISYHGGIDMEQEASWVGLGWNINPGVVGRSMRGLPDDMNGETIEKKINVKREETITGGLNAGVEIAGVGEPFVNLTADFSATVSHSNYRGYSVGFNVGLNANAGYKQFKPANAGLNFGVNSATGADIDYNLGASLTSAWVYQSDVGVGVSYTRGQGYNSRSAAKDKYEVVSGRITHGGQNLLSAKARRTVPIGINNVVPVITNASLMKIYRGRIKVGGELFWSLAYGGVNGMYTRLDHEKNGDAKGYGYLYAQNADDKSIHDFTRDKDGNFNETMKYLPMGSMTYDLYTLSGHGTGGSFRPFRNDMGTVYDPVVKSTQKEHDASVEAGIGNSFEIGGDYTKTVVDMESGPWKDYKRDYTSREQGKNYEPFYFKSAGELTATNSIVNNLDVVDGKKAFQLPNKIQANVNSRVSRGNLMTFFTNEEAAIDGVATMKQIESFPANSSINASPTSISRLGSNRRGSQIGEIVQNQTDGSKFVYSIPALNNIQHEYVFAVAGTNMRNGLVSHTATDASENNDQGRDNFYSKTTTPSFAHSFLLTSVLSTDYVDIKGDGPTDDDFGSYTKFNYSRRNNSYGWRAPFQENMANYNPGLKSDSKDDKGSFIEGTKEIWMLHTIETKNSVAEFYTSSRYDAWGIKTSDSLYKLDSIVLFNKNDRIQNLHLAKPIKTIIFQYNYELCPNTPNSKAANKGKLTLKKIYTRFGTSDRGMLSPYEFNYNAASNFEYNVANKNRWGGYKPNDAAKPNIEFPFVDRLDDNQDLYASAWHLSNIKLPSGGEINVSYESDDYAYVQDKPVMDIYYFEGVGNSKNFTSGNNLYASKTSPNLYFYFKRDKHNEVKSKNLHDNYLGGSNQLLFNVDIAIAHSNYESVKGYAEVEEVGYCNNDSSSAYGYVKVKHVETEKGNNKAQINPITYQSINYARYYLPETLYGSRSGTTLGDLKQALIELITIFRNPILRLVDGGKAKKINLSTSYLRLNNVGQIKKGGGHRVKRLTFENNWQSMSNEINHNESYGKDYHYSTTKNGRKISSGVASYEPALGSDDNPLKMPYPYKTQRGSNFPPNDAIGLYQEAPLGESLYPSPQVGYSEVTVTSIHKSIAMSAQSIDIFEFYTAADFPIVVKATSLDEKRQTNNSWNKQESIYEGSQGYTLVFNDMHGKQKKVEKRVAKPGTGVSELISYQLFKYYGLGSEIPIMEFDRARNQFVKVSKVLGQEVDLTLDSRSKVQESNAETHIANLNTSILAVVPIPIYLGFPLLPGSKDYSYNRFSSIVATKVVQQYGILETIESFNEGAVTIVKNEVFNGFTGQPLITSVNNEYNDLEYTSSIPAYLAYPAMGPSFQNIGYTENFANMLIKNSQGFLPVLSTIGNYKIGDELLINYKDNANSYYNNVWVMGIIDSSKYVNLNGNNYQPFDCINGSSPIKISDTLGLNLRDTFVNINLNNNSKLYLVVQPRYKSWGADRTVSNVNIKNVRSGYKNQLQNPLANYTSLESPFLGDTLKNKLNNALTASVIEYSNSNQAILKRYDSTVTADYDTLNPYLSGVRTIYSPHIQYAYLKNRIYQSLNRFDGVFGVTFPWQINRENQPLMNFDTTYYCYNSSDNYLYHIHLTGVHLLPSYDERLLVLNAQLDQNWIKSSYVTKKSPSGVDLEEVSSLGIFSTAVYGYNQTQPIGIASNARQNEVLFDGFEDYALYKIHNDHVYMSSSLIGVLLSQSAFTGGTNNYMKYNLQSATEFDITSLEAHSGNYSLKTKNNFSISLNSILNTDQDTIVGKFNSIKPFSGKKYLISFWYKPSSSNFASLPTGFTNVTEKIDGWQKAEKEIFFAGRSTQVVTFPSGLYIDDLRISPLSATAKSFVYNVWNSRLMATLDENNFATFYEYDLEGKLLRTKKETEKGIMTINESRSSLPKK